MFISTLPVKLDSNKLKVFILYLKEGRIWLVSASVRLSILE